jgi:hypothetical protein
MSNIFLMDGGLKAEDRLTYSWAYLLSTERKLGQKFVDLISARAGLPAAEFLTAIDHPSGTQRDRPDFLLRTSKWSMVMEHKLDAGLGVKQLERYLEYVGDGRKTYLGLVTPRLTDVPAAVLRHRRYRRPKGAQHFLWQDFYPLIERSRSKLVQDFGLYLGALGVQPWQWGRLGDPFTNPSADAALREVLDAVAERLRAPGRHIIRSRRALGLEIRKPLPGVHLCYLHAAPSIEEWDSRVQGRALVMNAWIKRKTTRPRFGPAYGYLRGSQPRIFVSDDLATSRWDRDVYREREFMTPLGEILGRSPAGAEGRIHEFVERCFEHLQGKGYLVEQKPL